MTISLAELRDLSDPAILFDEPIDDPKEALPPYGGSSPFVTGEVPLAMDSQPVTELARRLSSLSVEEAIELVRFGALWLNSRPCLDPFVLLVAGWKFRLNMPKYGPVHFYEADPARIVYEDQAIVVYDKESGRPVQAVPHDAHNNVLAALEKQMGLTLRLPHRLDAGTSGLVLLAKSKEVAGTLGKAFQEGKVEKSYLALSCGEKPDWSKKTVTAAIAKSEKHYVARANGPGLAARTDLEFLSEKSNKLLFLARPRTGRTHQIRLHLAYEGYSILGDSFYGGSDFKRLMLKAAGLRLSHPCTGQLLVLGGPWS